MQNHITYNCKMNRNKTTEVKSIFTDVMSKIMITKNKFIDFIKYKNKHNIKLDDDATENLKRLIVLWKNDKKATIDYYFRMKTHHSHIGNLNDTILNQLWQDYIMCGLEFRIKLIELEVILTNGDANLHEATLDTEF